MRTNTPYYSPKTERLLQEACPPRMEEVAEEYFLGRLPRAQMAAFEEHLLLCSHCVLTALRTMAFLEEVGRAPAFGGGPPTAPRTRAEPIPFRRDCVR